MGSATSVGGVATRYDELAAYCLAFIQRASQSFGSLVTFTLSISTIPVAALAPGRVPPPPPDGLLARAREKRNRGTQRSTLRFLHKFKSVRHSGKLAERPGFHLAR